MLLLWRWDSGLPQVPQPLGRACLGPGRSPRSGAAEVLMWRYDVDAGRPVALGRQQAVSRAAHRAEPGGA